MSLERRRDYPRIAEDLGFIKGKVESLDEKIDLTRKIFYEHVSSSEKFRNSIATSLFSICVVFIVQIVGFSFGYGILTNKVNEHIKKGEEHTSKIMWGKDGRIFVKS